MRPTPSMLLPSAALVVALPLLGATLEGQALAPYLDFPPRADAVREVSFSWPVFSVVAVLVLGSVAPFALRVLAGRRETLDRARCMRAMPCWGWLGTGVLFTSWYLAWSRHAWFEPLQHHTFTPLWAAYVLTINALTFRRTGRCLLTHSPRRLALLFPVSALFWWLFEYLNLFVRSWHYAGEIELGDWAYFWLATLSFSTVLPAVLCTREYLASFPQLRAGLRHAWRVSLPAPRALAAVTLVLSAAALAGIGVWPDYLFPALWVAPLAMLTSLQVIARERTIFDSLGRGDWRGLWTAALAALVCGLFWELWNAHSLAHWRYAVPFVHRYELFHMPVLGYAGYLPFGLLCMAVGRLVGR